MPVDTTWGGFGNTLPPLSEISAEDMAAHEASTSVPFAPTSDSAPSVPTYDPVQPFNSQMQVTGPIPNVTERTPVSASEYLTPDTDIAAQTARIMGEDSPLMKQAMTQALRGLVAGGRLDTDATATNVRNQMYQQAQELGAKQAGIAAQFGLGEQAAQSALSGIYAQGNVTSQQLMQKHQNTLYEMSSKYGYDWDVLQDTQDFQNQVLQQGYSQENSQLMANMYGGWVDSILSNAGRVMATPDATWTQDMQDVSEGMANAGKEWIAGLFGIPLS